MLNFGSNASSLIKLSFPRPKWLELTRLYPVHIPENTYKVYITGYFKKSVFLRPFFRFRRDLHSMMARKIFKGGMVTWRSMYLILWWLKIQKVKFNFSSKYCSHHVITLSKLQDGSLFSSKTLLSSEINTERSILTNSISFRILSHLRDLTCGHYFEQKINWIIRISRHLKNRYICRQVTLPALMTFWAILIWTFADLYTSGY